MRHFVFMKFEPGYFDDNVYTYIRTNFSRLQAVMSEDILSCRVSKNCVERDRNMDMMIEMELKDAGREDAERFEAFLSEKTGKKWKPTDAREPFFRAMKKEWTQKKPR